MLLQTKVWKKQPGKFFCISTKSAAGVWKDNWFAKSKIDTEVPAFINDNLDKDVYACPHGFNEKRRVKEASVDPHMLYADLDAIDPRTLEIKPTIAIESSPNRYVGYWLTDGPAPEQLNRRLSYMIGCDKSGWDRTQVLRVPNTRNYKYEAAPRVKILWTDGPTYEVDRLEKAVDQMKTINHGEVNSQATNTFKRYEKKLPVWVRRELIQGKPTVGKRSEVLWKLQNALLEVGMSRDEAFELLWICPWNKFKDRRDGVDQLWRELDKSLEQHFSGYSAHTEDDDPTRFDPLPKSLADVEIENIDWIVPGWLARKELTIIEGDPGLGKSYFTQMVAKNICDGKPVPCEEQSYEAIQGRVAYFDLENTAGTVTKARMECNGMVCYENYFQGEEPFTIDDEERWQRVVEVLEDLRPTLIVFDTINTYIGAADTYRSSETQQALGNFKILAVRFNCAVVIIRHLTKGNKDKALYRGQGSIAFTGAARIVLTAGQSPDDEGTRVIATTKNNISKRARALTWRIDALPDLHGRRNRSMFTWGDFTDLTSDDILTVAPAKNNDKEMAMAWLKELLADGASVEGSRIEKMAEARSITKTILQRASDALGIHKEGKGFGRSRTTLWSLKPVKKEEPARKRPVPQRRSKSA